MYTVLNYIRPFEGHREADVAPSENEFDSPALGSPLLPETLLFLAKLLY